MEAVWATAAGRGDPSEPALLLPAMKDDQMDKVGKLCLMPPQEH